MRTALIPLLILVLAACGQSSPNGPQGPEGPRGVGGPGEGPDGGPQAGPGPEGGPQPGRRPSDALQPAPDPGKNKSTLLDPGQEVRVRVELVKKPKVLKGQLVFLGVPEAALEEGWIQSGQRPSFFWVSPVVSFEGPISLMAPLPTGLHYFAILNLDGDDLPGPDDFVSSAVPHPAELADGAALAFAVTDRLGDRLPDDTDDGGDGEGDELPTDEGGEVRTLIIGNDVRLPFIRTGRFMVVGLPPSPEDEFGFPPDSTPSFLWVSEGTRLKWPVELQAKLPDAVDLLVTLDLDASGAPDVGDLTTEPMFRFRRPPPGESVTVTLQTVVPVPDGESGEDEPQGDDEPIEGPEEPGDSEEDEE